jgi:hypothetical protein
LETPVLLRTSERSTFRRCSQKWYWKYHRLLSHPKPKGALTFGTLIHSALEGWYPPGVERGVNPVETFRTLYAENAEQFSQWDDEGNKISAEELGEQMLTGYLELYGDDDDIEIIAPEQTFAIDVLDPKGNFLFTYVGKIDATARRRSTGRLLLLEHKTAKTIEEVQINSGYGEQGLSYLWAATIMLRHEGTIGPDEYFDGVLYNFLRKGLPSDRPCNDEGLFLNKPSKDALVLACQEAGLTAKEQKGTIAQLTERLRNVGWSVRDIELLGEVSKVQPSPLFARQELIVRPTALARFEKRIRAEGWTMNRIRKGLQPVYKNPTKDCRWDCEFVAMCELHEVGADWQSYAELELGKWNPYNDHEYMLEKT